MMGDLLIRKELNKLDIKATICFHNPQIGSIPKLRYPFPHSKHQLEHLNDVFLSPQPSQTSCCAL